MAGCKMMTTILPVQGATDRRHWLGQSQPHLRQVLQEQIRSTVAQPLKCGGDANTVANLLPLSDRAHAGALFRNYEVFLNFKGKDTRRGFTGNLFNALRQSGIKTFLDDKKLRSGEGISTALSEAIQESRVSIVVLSPNYAYSRWCLDELVQILNCRNKNGQHVVPIFYDVEPSDVRYQINSYADAMAKHESRFGKDSEKLKAWRSALSAVADLKGYHFNTGYEFELIAKIVKEVSAHLPPKPLHISQHLVGLEPRIEQVKSLLDVKSTDETVRILGIYGMGGIGKTTLAKVLYNKIVDQFEAACFLADVRQKSNKAYGLEDLQRTILSEMREELETELGSTSKGSYEIKARLGKKKVLLVLDDVDDAEQLEQLAGGCDWFGPGSKIIITTKDKYLLSGHQVQQIYEVTELNDQHSLELFCWNAFKQNHPAKGYEDVSSRAVAYCQRRPWALQKFGSDLSTKESLDDWECALKEFEKIPDRKIQNVLQKKFSYLTNINFSYNQTVTELPDLSEVPSLRELRFRYCKKLVKVHESIGFLEKLTHLSASGCTKLKYFLPRMHLPSLEILDLNFCVRLEYFPEVVGNMTKRLKINMTNTAIKELPYSIGNLIGLDCLEIPSSKKLRDLPNSLFMLPNFVVLKIGGCSQLRESFRRFIERPSISNHGSPALLKLCFEKGGLSDENLRAVLNCFPKLEELNASENNFVSLPACIEESVNLTSLDVSDCQKLQKIPEYSNLRALDVHRCVKLEHIKLPSTIQKVDARYCLSLSRETSDMLWCQVLKEIRGLEVVMPGTEIPGDLFHFSSSRGIPHFWARGKFPIVALALVFKDVNEMAEQSLLDHRHLIDLHLDINGQRVRRKGYHTFRIAPDHVLLCDLRVLFSNEEWLGLDAFYEHEWNLVQVSCEVTSNLTLSSWGVFIYKQEINMDDVQFAYPNPVKQQQMKMIEILALDEKFMGTLKEILDFEERKDFADNKGFAMEQMNVLMGGLKELSRQTEAVLESYRPLKKARQEDLVIEDNVKAPMDGGGFCVDASSSSHQGSSEVQGNDPQQKEIMEEIFLEGTVDGLWEAQISFPSLNINVTMSAALSKGNRVAWSLPPTEEGNPEHLLPPSEMMVYMEGIINGLLEALQNFPSLDINSTLQTVLNRRDHRGVFHWTAVVVPSSGESPMTPSDDPLLQAFMVIKKESLKSWARSKPYWKLKDDLRKKFEEFENETTALAKDCDTATDFISKKRKRDILGTKHNLDGTNNLQAKALKISDSKYASGSKEMQTDIGNEGNKGVTKHMKLAAILKERTEALRRFYDAGIEGFPISEEFEDLMSAVYLDGVRDGLHQAHVNLLAMDEEDEE